MKLEIKDKSIYLDDTQLKGVIDYKLEESLSCGAQLTVTLLVDSATVMPPEIPKIDTVVPPEVISPLSKLRDILGGERKYYGVSVDSPSPRLDERIREIVREEIAAHEERLKEAHIPLVVDGKQFAAMLNSSFRAGSSKGDKPPESQK